MSKINLFTGVCITVEVAYPREVNIIKVKNQFHMVLDLEKLGLPEPPAEFVVKFPLKTVEFTRCKPTSGPTLYTCNNAKYFITLR